MMITMGQLIPHFTIEYRKHFTNFHSTVTETAGGLQIGATECLFIMMFFQFIFCFSPATNVWATDKIDIQGSTGIELPFSLQWNQLICISTFYLSLQYNCINLYTGLMASKDKVYALMCMFPFF